jgi:hypothetical protein
MVKDVLTFDLIYEVVFPMGCSYRLASINPESGGGCIRGPKKMFKETAPDRIQPVSRFRRTDRCACCDLTY